MFDFINHYFWTLVVIFGCTTVVFMLLIFYLLPRIVRQLPENYFVDDNFDVQNKSWLLLVVRNFVGLLLVIAGPIVMLPVITFAPRVRINGDRHGRGPDGFPRQKEKTPNAIEISQSSKTS